MPKSKPALLTDKPGDIVAVDLGGGNFCYLRAYKFGHGVLPFLSRHLTRRVADFPSLAPRFFIQTWVYASDPTPMFLVGHAPFTSEQESWGQPMYYPPSPIEPCYKIHGVFNGLFSIIKPVTEADVVGLELFKRYQPAELRELLFARHKDWIYLDEVEI